MEKILSYIDIGKQEGAELLAGGQARASWRELEEGYYVQPTVFRGHNRMRIFQEEIFGPVVSVTTFRPEKDALDNRNDTLYGLGAGLWSRDANRCYRLGRGIPGRPRMDQLLPRLSGACGFWRLQTIGYWPRNACNDAGPLSADQETCW